MRHTNTDKAQNIKVIKDENAPETPEILAQALIQIGKGFDSLMKSQLTQRALITLLLDMPDVRTSRVSRSDIELVLNNLPKLTSYYIKKN